MFNVVDPDALLRIRVDDVEHLREVVNRLRRSGRVTGTKTLMVLDHWSRQASARNPEPAHPNREPRR